MPKKVNMPNGGYLLARQPGEAPSPKSGRPKNIFRQVIMDVAEQGVQDVVMNGYLVDDQGNVTKQKVKVAVTLPSVQAVVQRMFRQASKGDVSAAKWLAETAYGKSIKVGDDEDNPLGGGFAIILPDNKR